jgi:hypothetical protein
MAANEIPITCTAILNDIFKFKKVCSKICALRHGVNSSLSLSSLIFRSPLYGTRSSAWRRFKSLAITSRIISCLVFSYVCILLLPMLLCVLCGELRSSAQFSTQYTPHTHKIHAATLRRWRDNLLKTLSILMF